MCTPGPVTGPRPASCTFNGHLLELQSQVNKKNKRTDHNPPTPPPSHPKWAVVVVVRTFSSDATPALLMRDTHFFQPVSCTLYVPCTLYHAEHFSVSQFQPWMLIILTRTQLVLFSISNLLGALLCLPRLCLPQGLEPAAKPPAKPDPRAAKPRAKPSTKGAP